MVRCGADVVLCQHSHCVGCYEYFEGGHILYGQGNFHFSSFVDRECWYNGLLVELDIDKNKNEITFIPVVEKTDGSIELAKGEANKEILLGFAKRNMQLADGTWKDGWHEFCETQKEKYTNTLRVLSEIDTDDSKKQYFAHMLACEAHTDVWRELFPTWHITDAKKD